MGKSLQREISNPDRFAKKFRWEILGFAISPVAASAFLFYQIGRGVGDKGGCCSGVEPAQRLACCIREIPKVRREPRIRRDSLPKHRRPIHGFLPLRLCGG